eukprot:8382758-Alexandrium_andersonii.AAC.1
MTIWLRGVPRARNAGASVTRRSRETPGLACAGSGSLRPSPVVESPLSVLSAASWWGRRGRGGGGCLENPALEHASAPPLRVRKATFLAATRVAEGERGDVEVGKKIEGVARLAK